MTSEGVVPGPGLQDSVACVEGSLSRAVLFATTIVTTARAFLMPFAVHMRARGFFVHLACNDVPDGRRINGFDQVFEVQWSRSLSRVANLRAVLRFAALLRQNRYCLLHLHTPVAAFLGRLAVALLPKGGRPKVVYTAHGFHFYERGSRVANPLFLALEKLAGRWTDVLIVINREDEAAARRYRLVLPEQIRYVPGIGIDTEVYSPGMVNPEDVATVRASLGLTREDNLFVMVAEFNPGKRHRDVVKALARLGRSSVHLAFAGDGPLVERVKMQVRRLGLEGRVHFLGFRRDVPTLMRAATATLMPSEREGLNRSVMESLALEVPVIGSDARGVRDLLEDGCGVVVPVGDVETLARAMAWVLDHPEEAQEMARKGRQRVVAQHDIRHILKLHDEIYAELLGDQWRAQPVVEARN
ncbi:MAG: glycosyltransferase family 4 protein [Bacillota bacterium]